jgi:hypothetical protein
LGVTPAEPLARLRRNVDVLDLARWCRDRHAVFPHAFDVEGNSVADLTLDLRHGGTRSDTTGQVWNVGRVVALGLFNHDGITHTTSQLQTRLLEDAIQCARSEIIARFAGYCDPAGLRRVFELAVTAPRGHKVPAIGLQQAQNFANFHAASISGGTAPADC